eukprot:75740-Chlamydomonas_euryale.AAC.1
MMLLDWRALSAPAEGCKTTRHQLRTAAETVEAAVAVAVATATVVRRIYNTGRHVRFNACKGIV